MDRLFDPDDEPAPADAQPLVAPAPPAPAPYDSPPSAPLADAVVSDTPTDAPQNETFTVGELLRDVRDTVRNAFPRTVWVTGEIQGLSRPANGHRYFTLVDSGADERSGRSLRVVLFKWQKDTVNRILTAAHGAVRMADGVQIRISGKIDVFERRGELTFQMTSIDPAFTMGLLEAARVRLLAELRAEGALERNARLAVPALVLRVGVLTSIGSAAEADFRDELARSGYPFEVTAIDTRVQGVDAVESLLDSLDAAASIDVDVVVVIRGGGARTDLAAFDDPEVARAVADFPLPVFVGIGHESDTSVVDAVAGHSYKTPTAVAQALVARVRSEEDRVIGLAAGVALSARRTTERADARLVRSADRLHHTASARIRDAEARLDGVGLALRRVPQRFDELERRLDSAAAVAALRHPRLLARRGFAVVRTGSHPVRSSRELASGDEMDVEFADGVVTATVVSVRSHGDANEENQ